jgi:hypothetical protein
MNGKSNTYFPFSQVRQLVDADKGTSPEAVGLRLGAGVSYTLDEHGVGNKVCAVAVEVLPPGTLATEQTLPGAWGAVMLVIIEMRCQCSSCNRS